MVERQNKKMIVYEDPGSRGGDYGLFMNQNGIYVTLVVHADWNVTKCRWRVWSGFTVSF
jgi:hypothetical protein